MAKRTIKKWNTVFTVNKLFLNSLDTLETIEEVKEACGQLRNPIMFDNKVSDAKFELPYVVQGSGDMVRDHLIGMSNIVLLMYMRKLHKKCHTTQDYINTLRSLQVLLKMPKKLNCKDSFKQWQFDEKNIDDCLKWNNKLKNEGITHLESTKSGKMVPVDDVWNEWYIKFSSYFN